MTSGHEVWGMSSRRSVADFGVEITFPGSEVAKGWERVGRVLWRRRRVVFGLRAYCESSHTSAFRIVHVRSTGCAGSSVR